MSDTLIIEPRKNLAKLNLKELWSYKELLWTLTYRDIRVKYAQTTIGFLWAFVNPIFSILILSFVFGTVAKVGTDNTGVPHLLYTTVGLCGWTYFAALLADAGNSIIGAQNMVKKIYFPRLIIPLSKALTAFIDLVIVLLIIAILMTYYKIMPSANLIYLPFFLGIAVIAGLAGGIWMSALTIRFRDFKHVIPLMLRVGMYATPIAFPASAVPEKYKLFFYMNPMAGVVEGVRWSILGGQAPNQYVYISFVVIILLFISGVYYFNFIERKIADIL